ncbi:MAG: peptidase, partial [Actinomycetes bacterium]
PVTIPFVPSKQLPDASLHYPIEPQVWHFRQSIDYSLTANWAVLDIASRNRENFLFNIWRMGMNSIERGNRDSWTPTPRHVIAAQAALAEQKSRADGLKGADTVANPAAVTGTAEQFTAMLRAPELRDPRGFILPSDQPDFPTATKFINALLKVGVIVHRATAPFTAAGKAYPAGSYVVKTAQAFRPHVLDMFEPQDHPDDIPYPGGPPTRPYDNAGWTLAYQMGVKFDRVLEKFDGPFERVQGLLNPAPGKVTGIPGTGYVFTHAMNDSFTAINRLINAGEDVSWITAGPQQGAFYVASKPSTPALVTKIASALGVNFAGVAARPAGEALKLHKMRVALADQYGGSMPSGWTRFLFEQFEFPFEVVYPKMVNAGNLASKYDVIIFPSSVGPGPGEGSDGTAGRAGRGAAASGASTGFGQAGATEADIPAEYRPMVGAYTVSETGPALKKFVEDGGTIIAVGRSASNLAQLFGLPIGNHLVERGSDGRVHQVPSEKFYVPGSILSAAVDTSIAVAQGVTNPVDVFYDNSPVFRLEPEAAMKGIKPVAWFASATPLRSGWAYGQSYLENGIIGVDVPVGRGRLFLFTPEITFRGQPHGTFKFLFNGIYLAGQSASRQMTAETGR